MNRVLLGVGVLVVVVYLILGNMSLRTPLPIGLVHSGVRSVTVCNVPLDGDDARFEYLSHMNLPGDKVGTWDVKKKDNCYVYYHYAE